MKNSLANHRRDFDRGSVLLEFALLLPLVLVVLGAAVDLGFLFREEQQMAEAVRAAGRAVGGYHPTSGSPDAELCQVAKQAVKDSFLEGNSGSIAIDLENVDINDSGTIPDAGSLFAVRITVHRDGTTRPSFFQRLMFQTGVRGIFYLESQIKVSTTCSV